MDGKLTNTEMIRLLRKHPDFKKCRCSRECTMYWHSMGVFGVYTRYSIFPDNDFLLSKSKDNDYIALVRFNKYVFKSLRTS